MDGFHASGVHAISQSLNKNAFGIRVGIRKSFRDGYLRLIQPEYTNSWKLALSWRLPSRQRHVGMSNVPQHYRAKAYSRICMSIDV